ncbi:MSHA biogenesis protein MshM [hydrothermal vent metagenome]|uniref:MSHA biogenesis protein MshM n=1 Tax=hydrothermal vent metagenome TaxID=652676 RepID=A0A3B1AF75_9ZZZZ
MYLEHFGLREMPFSLTPDTEFFYRYGAWQEAFEVLMVALRGGEGFIKISGEVGTGKTLLCRKLLASIDEGEFVTAWLPNPCLTPAALRMALADELGIRYPRNQGQHRLLTRINEALVDINASGRRVVVLLDEAQALPDDTLEALRLLTNLETEKRKLLQVVLFGQPELDERLAQPGLRQLRQRIGFSHHLRAIDREGLPGYLNHRLLVAGYHATPLFSAGAQAALFKASRGIPRLINILAHKSLMAAFGRGLSVVNRDCVVLACADTEGVVAAPRGLLARLRSRRGAALAAGMGALGLVALMVGAA